MASKLLMKMPAMLTRRGAVSQRVSRRGLAGELAGAEVPVSQDVPVLSYNEWDPLEEVLVGRAEGQRIPFLHPDMQAKTGPDAWKWMREKGGQPHEAHIVETASKQVAEFCKVLEMEGVRVKRPEPMRWDELGTFNTPFYKDGGYMNACPRDGLIVVGDEIIESPLAWRSRMFEYHAYKNILNDYFKRGARWTAVPRPCMSDALYKQDFPYEDTAQREKMAYEGEYILTEAEVAFDGADAQRFGRDIVVSLSNATNRSGVEWLRRHLGPRGYRVHSLIFKGIQNCHADATFVPLRPGLLAVCPVRPCYKVNDVPTNGWDWFTNRGWEVREVPDPVCIPSDMHFVSKWVSMNVLSLDEERVVMQKGEEPLRRFFVDLGLKPIEVDMRSAFHLGGAFHCWTADVKRRGTLQDYFS